MPSLTIPFPEGTRTIGLRGKRIMIGRLPDNTVQIRDRTISAYHAELIEEGDHYCIHDKGSTNGIVINGQRVTDYHLQEDCKVSIGGVVCEFVAAQQDAGRDEIDTIPTRSEMQTILQANDDLRSEIAALRGQVETMTKAREETTGSEQTVPLEQHDKLAQELTAVRSTLQDRQTQIDRLTSLLAIATREKEVLQKGYDDACSTLDKARAPSSAVAEKPTAPVARVAAPVTGVAANRPTERLIPDIAAAPQPPKAPPTTPLAGAPKAPAAPGIQPAATPPTAVPKSPAAPTAPVTASAPKAPSNPVVPATGAKPAGPSPSVPTAPASGIAPRPAVAPGAPKVPSATPAAATTPRPAPSSAPSPTQTPAPAGARPLPKPPGSLGAAAGAGSPVRRPASAIHPAKPAPAPTTALATAGPKGTQKLVE